MKLRSEISLEATATWPQLENTVVKSRTLTSDEARCAPIEMELQAIVNSIRRANISTTTESHQKTCSAMIKTAIDLSTSISTTQIVQTNRHQIGL